MSDNLQKSVVIALTALVTGTLVAKRMILPRAADMSRKKIQQTFYEDYISFCKELKFSTPFIPGSDSPMQEKNNELLLRILKRNADTVYGKAHNFGAISSVEEFRDKVPIIFYNDIASEIERLCAGETNILSTDKIIYFATSSGTTGKQKMIPITTGSFEALQVGVSAACGAAYKTVHEAWDYNFTDGGMPATIQYNPSNHKRTKSGIAYGPLSQSNRALSGIYGIVPRALWLLLNAIPMNITDRVTNFETNILIQCLFCLLAKDMHSLSHGFGTVLNHFFVLMRDHFINLVQCIEDGSLNAERRFIETIPSDVVDGINQYIKKTYSQQYLLARAEELRKIHTFEGCAMKIWPKLKFAVASVTGTFSVYENNIRYYLGDIPLLGAFYISSEASMGFQFNIEGDYMFLPSATFFEFIPEEEINSEKPKTLLVSELEVDKRYEVVVTTQSGFYRYRVGDVIHVVGKVEGRSDIPLFRIAYRTGSILDAYGEKTTEEHVENALIRTAEAFGCKLTNFTTYLEIDASPVRYMIFPEFSGELTAEQQASLDKEVDKHLCDVHQFYAQCRDQDKLANVVCKLVTAEKFTGFTDLLIKNGAAGLQAKVPHLLKKKSYLDYFLADE